MDFLPFKKSEWQLPVFIVAQCSEAKRQGELSSYLHSKKMLFMFFLFHFLKMK